MSGHKCGKKLVFIWVFRCAQTWLISCKMA
nr:MAG TPA: hypothetical protein [Caudoviricetes sp.]